MILLDKKVMKLQLTKKKNTLQNIVMPFQRPCQQSSGYVNDAMHRLKIERLTHQLIATQLNKKNNLDQSITALRHATARNAVL